MVDLKDPYFLVAIAKEHKKFLRFVWQGRIFQFNGLPFSLCSVLRMFTMNALASTVMAHLRQQGIRCVIYLDDLILMAERERERECS